MVLLLILLFIATLFVLFCFYLQHKCNYWINRGVEGPRRNIWKLFTRQEKLGFNPGVYELHKFDKYGKVYGRVGMLTPSLVVNDPECIKQIMIRDFHLMMNKPMLRTYDEMWNLNLFNVDGDRWKRIRSITSPTFTSGKLRGMHRLMNKCVDMLSNYLENVSLKNGVLDIKDVITGFTINVIASTSFATETNATDPNSKKSPFAEHGVRLFRFKFWRILASFMMPPQFNALFNIRHQFEPKDFNFFGDLVREIVRQRKSGKVEKRNDFVQLLMDAFVYDKDLNESNYDNLTADLDKEELKEEPQSQSKGNKSTLTESEITAQCLIFFVAGFETTASTITYMLFELAKNQDIQERLKDELNEKLDGIDVHSDEYFETVMSKIPYMDAVIKETLRKYPPLVRLERRVGVDGYKINGITLEKDTAIVVSTYTVHHNPEYYPDPERFNPDRFMPENKHLLVPYTYLPFGTGPRNCVGMRFAYQEIKLCLAQIVSQFIFSPTDTTPDRLQFSGGSLLLTPAPFTLKVAKR